MSEPDWDTVAEQQIEAERDFFGRDETAAAEGEAWEGEPPY